MLTKPSKSLLRSLKNLPASPSWKEIDNFFGDELKKVYEQMSLSRDDVILRQMQGRAQFIQEFQTMVREAPALLEKLGDNSL